MNAVTMPGFTAEDSLYKTVGQYQTDRHTINSSAHMSSTPNELGAAALTLALDNRLNVTATVDCKTFPDSITCHECYWPGNI
jgi:hypothetical protein